ncbi:unnamed protein product [Camellia sinensis]
MQSVNSLALPYAFRGLNDSLSSNRERSANQQVTTLNREALQYQIYGGTVLQTRSEDRISAIYEYESDTHDSKYDDNLQQIRVLKCEEEEMAESEIKR